jgi:hypothetical protein
LFVVLDHEPLFSETQILYDNEINLVLLIYANSKLKLNLKKKKEIQSWVPVVHACNPSYLGD